MLSFSRGQGLQKRQSHELRKSLLPKVCPSMKRIAPTLRARRVASLENDNKTGLFPAARCCYRFVVFP